MSAIIREFHGNQYKITHKVGYQSDPIRLDRFLMRHYRSRSRGQLQRAIDSGAVIIIRDSHAHMTVGKIKASTTLQGGDIVQLISTRKPEPEVNFNYKVLYEDDEIIVVLKPANLPVHPAGRFFFNTLISHLKSEGFSKDPNRNLQFLLVHRIDKETSGVLLLAKNRAACKHLHAQFKNREVSKYYLALVKGEPKETEFTVDAAINKVKGARIGLKMYPVPESKGGLPSVTHFKKLETRTGPEGTFSLLACYPQTGRQHQIRAHAEIAGYPLVGDKVYGMSEEDADLLLGTYRGGLEIEAVPSETEEDEDLITGAQEFDDLLPEDADETDSYHIPVPQNLAYAEQASKLFIPRHALHAAGLKFKHPTSNQEMNFETELPDDLKSFFDRLQKP